MKITVKSDALQVLASTRAVFTSTKGNSPISRNARLTTEGNTLILRTTNGAVSLYMRIGGVLAGACHGRVTELPDITGNACFTDNLPSSSMATCWLCLLSSAPSSPSAISP